MLEDTFGDLKNAIIAQDDVNKLKLFSDIMEKMTDYIVSNNKEVSNDVLANTIERQKVIFEVCEKCYEKILNNEDAMFLVDELKSKFEDYKGFVDENYK